MDQAKVKVIQDWPEPQKVKDIQSFLRFANFYWRFIDRYSDIVLTLTCLTRKKVPRTFTNQCHDTFNKLKTAFTSTPILSHFIPSAPIIIEMDTSDYAVAAILSTVPLDGHVHPVAFHSQTLGISELNYDTHNKELLAIFEAF
jgi:hypothetical protein